MFSFHGAGTVWIRKPRVVFGMKRVSVSLVDPETLGLISGPSKVASRLTAFWGQKSLSESFWIHRNVL